MEVAPPQSGLVHVMRHSFKPSDHLAIALENYLQPGVTRPRIFLHATRLIRLDMQDYAISEVRALHAVLNRDFTKRHREKVFLGKTATEPTMLNKNEHEPKRRVMARQLGGSVLRVGFIPSDEAEFKTYLSNFDVLEPLVPSGAKKIRDYLFADIPIRSVDSSRIQENTQTIAENLESIERARAFYVSPGMVSLDAVLKPILEQGRTSDN